MPIKQGDHKFAVDISMCMQHFYVREAETHEL